MEKIKPGTIPSKFDDGEIMESAMEIVDNIERNLIGEEVDVTFDLDTIQILRLALMRGEGYKGFHDAIQRMNADTEYDLN